MLLVKMHLYWGLFKIINAIMVYLNSPRERCLLLLVLQLREKNQQFREGGYSLYTFIDIDNF